MTARNRLTVLIGVVLSVLAANPAPGGGPAPRYEWRLTADDIDERTGAAPDVAGVLEARVLGGVSFTQDGVGALRLSGDAGARVAITEDPSRLPREAISVEAWVRIDEPRAWSGIVTAVHDTGAHERGWALCLLGEGRRLGFAVKSESADGLTYLAAPTPIAAGAWIHAVGTYDGRVQRIYLDGELAAESTAQRGPIDYEPLTRVNIGCYQDDNDVIPLTGAAASAAIFDAALTRDEVAARFAARRAAFPGPREPAAPAPRPTDWPTHLASPQRLGLSASSIEPPLHLRWVRRERFAPSPSWPPPALRDPYNRKPKLEPRVVYDRAFHLVGADGVVLYGSSSDDRVRCLDLETGRVRWSFQTEGPVRAAPTLADGAAYFGSDDGRVYAVDLAWGRLRWATRLVDADRRVPGNGRVISLWPVRTGVTAHEGRGFVCAGLFPVEGVVNAILDLETGEIVKSKRIDQPVQGYMVERDGQLRAPTGRALKGADLGPIGPSGRRTPTPEALAATLAYPYAMIGGERVRFGGGDGRVAALDPESGRELWTADVEGKAYALAIVDDRLLVSTDAGVIYCFAPEPGETIVHEPEPDRGSTRSDERTRRGVLEAVMRVGRNVRFNRGYALVLGSGRGELAAELARQTPFRVIGVDDSPERVRKARLTADRMGLADRLVYHHVATDELPYVSEMFNLIVVDDRVRAPREAWVDAARSRLLRPYGGVFVPAVTRPATPDVRTGAPEGAGEWTHAYGTPGAVGSADDRRLSSDMTIQWYGPPGPRNMVDRHQRNAPPLFSNGVLYIPGYDHVYAVDAYNGTILWEHEVPDMFRPAMNKSSGNMVASPYALFVASGGEAVAFNARSGSVAGRYPTPSGDDWGYIGLAGETLIGSATRPGSQRWEITQSSWTIAYSDDHEVICSDELFGVGVRDRGVAWRYAPEGGGVIVNPTIAHDGDAVYFIECRSADAAADADGRVRLRTIFDARTNLVAVDAASGGVRYRRPIDLTALQHVVYLSVSDGKILVTGSKYLTRDDGSRQLLYDLRGLDAATGEEVWRLDHPGARQVIGGIHGEQTDRPVIAAGDRVHLDVRTYDLHTGELLWTAAHKTIGGCGPMSGSADFGFRRVGAPTMIDLRTGAGVKLTHATRPGCWINIIPAGGLVLIPEASSGCSCQHAIQTSLVLRPRDAPAPSR